MTENSSFLSWFLDAMGWEAILSALYKYRVLICCTTGAPVLYALHPANHESKQASALLRIWYRVFCPSNWKVIKTTSWYAYHHCSSFLPLSLYVSVHTSQEPLKSTLLSRFAVSDAVSCMLDPYIYSLYRTELSPTSPRFSPHPWKQLFHSLFHVFDFSLHHILGRSHNRLFVFRCPAYFT